MLGAKRLAVHPTDFSAEMLAHNLPQRGENSTNWDIAAFIVQYMLFNGASVQKTRGYVT